MGLTCTILCMERNPITESERIAARISVEGECWVWLGFENPPGYPTFAHRGKFISIVPLLWEQKNGPTPEGKVLICTHPQMPARACVNPAHHELTTPGKWKRSTCEAGHDLTDPTNVIRLAGQTYCVPCMARRTG